MKIKKATVAILIITACLVFGAKAGAAYPQTITVTSPFVNMPRPDDDPRWAQAFSHWDKREDTEEVEKALAIFEELARDQADKPMSHVWRARALYIIGMRQRGEKQVETMKLVTEAAGKALELDPANDCARFWRNTGTLFVRDFTEEEFKEIREMGKRYDHLRELVVPDDDPAWAEAIRHWDARADLGESKAAIAGFEALEKKYPNRIEPKLWLMRVNYWMFYVEPVEEKRTEWLLVAAEWGEKAIELEPRNPAANYLTAASLGQYSSHTSTLSMARHAMDITKKLMLVMEEDPIYFYGGVSQYFALAISRAGKIMSKALSVVGFPEELIVRNTNFAVNFEPRYVRNHYALGEMYLSMGEKEKARTYLETAVNADPAALKNMEPENRKAQELARKTLEENF